MHEHLAAIGQANPTGPHRPRRLPRRRRNVFDVWEQETFEAFGQHLMPILAESGIDPGEPRIGVIELVVNPA